MLATMLRARKFSRTASNKPRERISKDIWTTHRFQVMGASLLLCYYSIHRYFLCLLSVAHHLYRVCTTAMLSRFAWTFVRVQHPDARKTLKRAMALDSSNYLAMFILAQYEYTVVIPPLYIYIYV